MELTPRLYHWFVRPFWYNRNFIVKTISSKFNFQNKKVLDFGCGIGSNCFLSQPENYLGVDPDQKRINYARKNNPGYSFEVLYNCGMLLDKKFDIILIVAVLHHIPEKDLHKILEIFSKILNAKGKIIVLEPCLYSKNSLNNYLMQLLDRGKYIRHKKQYFTIFHDHNFKIYWHQKIPKFFYREILFSAKPL